MYRLNIVLPAVMFAALCGPAAQAQVASENPAKMLQFKSASNKFNYLPVVEAHHYSTLCDALLFSEVGAPAYAQIHNAVSTGCSEDTTGTQRVQLFGGFGETCRVETALRKDHFLSSPAQSNTELLTWGDHFRENSDLGDAEMPAFRTAFQMYNREQREAQTNYLLMRLPLASVGKAPEARRSILRAARICETLSDDVLDERLRTVVHDKFLVFDPQAPAQSAFLFDDLNTPVQLFFAEDDAEGSQAPLLQLNPEAGEAGPRAWTNRIYKYQWGPRSDSLSSILVPKRPFWQVTLDTAQDARQAVAVTASPQGGQDRIILQFTDTLVRNASERSASEFRHDRIALPFNDASTTRAQRSDRVASVMSGLVPREGTFLEVRETDDITFAAILNTSLDAGHRPKAGSAETPRQSCIDDLSRLVFRANSPFAAFGDDAPYALRLDGTKVNVFTYANSHCQVLDHYAADENARTNRLEPGFDWFTKAAGPEMKHVEFSAEDLRDVRLPSGRTVKLPPAIWSKLKPSAVRHPSFPNAAAVRHPVKFVLVDDESGAPYYLQDFSVSTMTALAYFNDGRIDYTRLVQDLLARVSYQNKCYGIFFDLEVLVSPADVAAYRQSEHRDHHLLWLMSMHEISGDLASKEGGIFGFLQGPADEDCHKKKAFAFSMWDTPRILRDKRMQDTINSAFEDVATAEQEYDTLSEGDDGTKVIEPENLAKLVGVLRTVEAYAKRIVGGEEYPLMLVNNVQALRLVHGAMGMPTDSTGAFVKEVGFQGLNWRLQPMTKSAHESLSAARWPLYSLKSEPTGITSEDIPEQNIVPFGGTNMSYILPHRPHLNLPVTERILFGVHNLTDGPHIPLADGSAAPKYSGRLSFIESAEKRNKFNAFSARMMLALVEEELED